MTYLRALLLLPDLGFPAGPIALRALSGSAHVHDGILESPLVVQPCRTLGLVLTLEVRVGLGELSEALLRLAQLLLECLDLGLHTRQQMVRNSSLETHTCRLVSSASVDASYSS